MKNPYVLGFWCAIAALVLLSATYFYGIMLAHQIEQLLARYLLVHRCHRNSWIQCPQRLPG